MKNRIFKGVLFASALFFSLALTAFEDDKITVYKGKDSAMIDADMNFCAGSGAKCAELTTSQLKDIIKTLKE